VVGFCLLALGSGCSRPETNPAEIIRPVRTTVVAAGEQPDVRVFPGKVEASKTAELAFQMGGLLVNVPVIEGQHVAKGGIIAQLRPDEFEARVAAVQGQLDQAKAALSALRLGERPEEQIRRETQVRAAAARLANAKTELERYGRLIKSNAVSQAEYELAQTTYQVAGEEQKAALQLAEKGTVARKEDIEASEASIRPLEGRLAEANVQLKDSTLRAPYDGVVAQRFVDAGQAITQNKPVVRFKSTGIFDVVMDVPESVIAAGLRPGRAIPMTAELDGMPGQQFPATIKEISQTADPATQTFQVRVTLQGTRGITALPGMSAGVTARFRGTGKPSCPILVPATAVTRPGTSGPIVWIVGKDETATRRAISVGAAIGDQVEVVSGLRPGERIITAGAAFVSDGMRVRDLGNELGDVGP
jgi:RND family efflux transporter MFP subunit